MSFQAGLTYFDHGEVPAHEAAALQDWVRSGDGLPKTHSQPGVFLAQSATPAFVRASADAQPFVGPNNAITFDGRLDNRPDLLVALRDDLGPDTSDAALALAAYQRWGCAGLGRLIGDWSLALWDGQRQAVVLASDFSGVRPLYYCVQPHRVAWSTRLGPLAHWLQAREIDDTYVAGLLAFGGCPNRTPYRGVLSVPPGHAVSITAGDTAVQRFWEPPFAGNIRYSRESDYEEHLLALFREAVRCRIPADAVCLCHLSGGLDSSSIVTMAADMRRTGALRPKRLVTLSFEHENSVDRRFYLAVEEFWELESIHLSTASYPFLAESDPGGAWPAYWEPLHKYIAGIARQIGAGTCLTGLLGDTVMGNWPDDTEQVAGLLRRNQIRAALRQALAWSRATRVPVAWILGRSFLSALPPSLTAARWCRLNGWAETPSPYGDSIAPDFRKRTGLADRGRFFSGDWIQARPERRKHFRSLMYTLELRRLQPPEPLEHLSYAHPYGHRPLVEFMLSIPAEIVCGPGEPRRLMRRALHPLWPPALRGRRSKDSFDVAFLQSLRFLAGQLLNSRQPLQVVEAGYVDRESLQARLERIALSLDCNQEQLRQIILLEVWLRQRAGRPQPQPLVLSGAGR